MAGRSPHQAETNYIDPLQKAVSCITNEVLIVSAEKERRTVALAGGRLVRARTTHETLLVCIAQKYSIVEDPGERGPWKARTLAYYYTVSDDKQREILSYHWHPEGESSITIPHIHLRGGAGLYRQDLCQMHIPTGRIALEDFLEFLIEGFGVRPKRSDWRQVLKETKEKYQKWKTW